MGDTVHDVVDKAVRKHERDTAASRAPVRKGSCRYAGGRETSKDRDGSPHLKFL